MALVKSSRVQYRQKDPFVARGRCHLLRQLSMAPGKSSGLRVQLLLDRRPCGAAVRRVLSHQDGDLRGCEEGPGHARGEDSRLLVCVIQTLFGL